MTEAGEARFPAATKGWVQTQWQFEKVFRAERTADMRALLRAVAATDLGTTAVSPRGVIQSFRGTLTDSYAGWRFEQPQQLFTFLDLRLDKFLREQLACPTRVERKASEK